MFHQKGFKTAQLQFQRVKDAFAKFEASNNAVLKKHEISPSRLDICIRVFKHEKMLELWAKNREDASYEKIREFPVSTISGTLGPKRKEGDKQTPEGFYYINMFNPNSRYHLSVGINYPNKSDRIMADKNTPGSDICIHGNTVTVGCIPITDTGIEELYAFCVEAKNNGWMIPASFFPFRMTDENITSFKSQHAYHPDCINLWEDLKTAFDYFEKHHVNPGIVFLNNGRHKIS